MTFGENLKQVRKKFCLTQLQMATRMDISRPYYNKLENDKVSISIAMLIYITKAANIPINKLVNDHSKYREVNIIKNNSIKRCTYG